MQHSLAPKRSGSTTERIIVTDPLLGRIRVLTWPAEQISKSARLVIFWVYVWGRLALSSRFRSRNLKVANALTNRRVEFEASDAHQGREWNVISTKKRNSATNFLRCSIVTLMWEHPLSLLSIMDGDTPLKDYGAQSSTFLHISTYSVWSVP